MKGGKVVQKLFLNPMLYGMYRDNPNYCEPYMDKETFDRIQEIGKLNLKEKNGQVYIFSGMLVCPVCGCKLVGNYTTYTRPSGKCYRYKKYRCQGYRINDRCTYSKSVSENVIERLLLERMEQYLDDAKIRVSQIEDAEPKAPQFDIDEIHEEIDRLNYSWQKGMIRKVEQYEEQHRALMEKLEKAEAEQGEVIVRDFSKVEAILQEGWKSIYENLEPTYRRAYWRSFIRTIEIDEVSKEVTRLNFF